MDFDDDFDDPGLTLNPRGWLNTFSLAFGSYKKTAVMLFFTGLVATFFDVLSFGVILAGLELFKPNGEISLLGVSIRGPLTQMMIIQGIVIFGCLRLVASFAYYYTRVLAAKTRRITFRDFILKAIECIEQNPSHPFVRGETTRSLSRLLRRECRYASRAVTDALLLPRPVIILGFITLLGILYQPVILLILSFVLIISVPFHVLTARWGSKVMEEVLIFGAQKSQEDRIVIDDLLRSPFANKFELGVGAGEEHVRKTPVDKFLFAYEKRARLTPVSQLVSSLTFLAIFLVLGAIVLLQFNAGEIDIVAITAIIILTRFASTAIIDLASNVTVIASYSPLISDFFDFIKSDQEPPELKEITIEQGGFLSNRACLISKTEMNIPRAKTISKLWRKPFRENHFIHGRFSKWQPFSSETVMKAFEWSWKDMSPNLRAQIETAIDDIENATEPAAALIAAWLNTQDSRAKNIFWDSRSFSQITGADRDVIMGWLKKIRLLLHYSAVPRGVPLIENMDVWLERDNVIYKFGDPNQFKHARDSIIKFMNHEITFEDLCRGRDITETV